MRVIAKSVALVALFVFCPSLASAQAVIAGEVKDASGAVLPGVTVESTSPALIEKVRTAVTDGTGQYRIENLRPGTYTVTFSLSGFSTTRREGIELTGSFTATVDAEMRVGAVQETVTVTGASPIVDVQSSRREMTIDNDVIRSIPNQRNYGSMVAMVPGVLTNVNDPAAGTVTTQFPIHGGRANESRMWVDGLNIGNPPGGGQPPTYVADIGNAQEIAFTTSGGLGESETAGLVMNVVPKTGGNEVHGAAFYSGTGENLQADNGSGVPPLNSVYDLNFSIGGPIMKDRVWYFLNGRTQGATRYIPGIFYNANAGNASSWLYSPIADQPQFTDRKWENISGRVTWQATAKHKIGGFWDEQVVCRTCEGTTYGITDPARMSPEAGGLSQYKPLRVTQLTYSSPVLKPSAARGRHRHDVLRLGELRARSEPDAQSHSRVGAMRGYPCSGHRRLSCQRQHPRPRLPLAGLRRQLHRRLRVARVGVLHHRRAQCEDRPPGLVLHRRSHLVHQRSEPDLSTEQRPAQSAHAVDLAVGEQRACGVDGVLRAGAVDARPPHAAGRHPLRPCRQLVPRAAARAVAVPANADRRSRRRRAWTATTTSRRESGWRGTCSAPDGPR